jgi:hypothetical protein
LSFTRKLAMAFAGLLVVGGPAYAFPDLNSTTGWAFINPTNTIADETTLQTALTGNLPVFMSGVNAAGTPTPWRICSDAAGIMPDHQVLWGVMSNSNPGSNGYSSNGVKTLIYCPDGSGARFNANSGYITPGNNSVVGGITIVGNSGDSKQVKCINIDDRGIGVTVMWTETVTCDIGISHQKISGLAQTAWIVHNFIYGNVHWGMASSPATTDDIVQDNWIVSNGSAGGGSTAGQVVLGSSGQFINNRVEDGGDSIYCGNCQEMIIANNYFDRLSDQMFLISNGQQITFSGNRFYGYADGSHTTMNAAMRFNGANSGIRFDASNLFEGGMLAAFWVESGSVSSSQFAVIPTAVPPFFDLATEQALSPQFSSPPFGAAFRSAALSSSTYTPDFPAAPNVLFNLPHTMCPCTIAAPFPFLPGYSGMLQTCQSAAGSDAATFDGSYVNPPTLSTGARVCDYTTYSVTASGKTLLGNKVSVTPPTNELTGGNGMTSGWTTTGLTSFTTGLAGDPIGTSTAARMTENTNNSGHEVDQATTLGESIATCAWDVKAGTGATRYAVAAMFSSNAHAEAAFDLTTGAFQPPSYVSNGAVVLSTGSAPEGGGWWRVWISSDMTNASGGPVALAQTMYMAKNPFQSGGNFNYTGDGTTNMLVWGPTCRAGIGP